MKDIISINQKELKQVGKAFGFTAKQMKEGMEKLVEQLPTCKRILKNFTIGDLK